MTQKYNKKTGGLFNYSFFLVGVFSKHLTLKCDLNQGFHGVRTSHISIVYGTHKRNKSLYFDKIKQCINIGINFQDQ